MAPLPVFPQDTVLILSGQALIDGAGRALITVLFNEITDPNYLDAQFRACVLNAEEVRQVAYKDAKLAFVGPSQVANLVAAMRAADITYFQSVLLCAQQTHNIAPSAQDGLKAVLES